MAAAVYVLCAATSLACALLLARGYWRSRSKLLLWSVLCFFGLALENILLFIDLVVLTSIDLSLWRSLVALAAVVLLLIGMIWEST